MKRVATAAVLIPIVLLAVLRAPVPLLAAIAAVVALLATREFLHLSQAYGVQPLWWTTYVAVALLFVLLGLNFGGEKALLSTGIFVYSIGAAAALAAFIFLVIGMARRQLATALPAAAAALFAFAYVGLPLGFAVQLRQQWAGAFLLLYLLVVVWIGDICAYYAGRGFGRHLLAPRISPKKTWEGAIASFLGSLLAGGLLFSYALPISLALLQAGLIERRDGYFALEKAPLPPVLALTAVLNVAAQLGDLTESLIKRGAGVKDSGSLLPGHGGMLDRIDALLFAAPVLWYYAAWRVLQ